MCSLSMAQLSFISSRDDQLNIHQTEFKVESFLFKPHHMKNTRAKMMCRQIY